MIDEKLMNAILSPISSEKPSGEDIIYDEVMTIIKRKRLEKEEKSLGVWKLRKSTDDYKKDLENSIENLCIKTLENKSKHLQVISYFLEELILNDGLVGLSHGYELLQKFCVTFWDSLYPIEPPEEYLEMRKAILSWLDNQCSYVLRLIPILNSFEGLELTFDKIDLIHSTGVYSQVKNKKADSDTQEKYRRFIKSLTGKKIEENILFYVEETQKHLRELNKFLNSKYATDGEDYFIKLNKFLERFYNFFNDIKINEDKKQAAAELTATASKNEEQELANDIEPEITESPASVKSKQKATKNLDEKARNKLYDDLLSLAHKLKDGDPHSPVPDFILKVLSWKDYSFSDIAFELGFSSPFLSLLTMKKEQEGLDMQASQNDGYQNPESRQGGGANW